MVVAEGEELTGVFEFLIEVRMPIMVALSD
jgi:hypothetical protein